jgi:hypothetical protein
MGEVTAWGGLLDSLHLEGLRLPNSAEKTLRRAPFGFPRHDAELLH